MASGNEWENYIFTDGDSILFDISGQLNTEDDGMGLATHLIQDAKFFEGLKKYKTSRMQTHEVLREWCKRKAGDAKAGVLCNTLNTLNCTTVSKTVETRVKDKLRLQRQGSQGSHGGQARRSGHVHVGRGTNIEAWMDVKLERRHCIALEDTSACSKWSKIARHLKHPDNPAEDFFTDAQIEIIQRENRPSIADAYISMTRQFREGGGTVGAFLEAMIREQLAATVDAFLKEFNRS